MPLVLRIWLGALLWALVSCASLAATDGEPSLVWREREVAAQYWADPSGEASLASVRAAFEAGQGLPVNFDQLMPLGHGRAVWYRLQLAQVKAPVRAVFSVNFAGTDDVQLFRPDAAGGWGVQRSGDLLPVNEWPMRYLKPAFTFTVQPGEMQPSYLRIAHNQPLRVGWMLWDAADFSETNNAWHVVLGAYGGFMLLVVLFSVWNTFVWRDSIHLYYALHVILVGLSVMALTGIAGEHLWPAHAWWNDKAPVVLPAAAVAWAGLLVRELVAERGRRWISWALLANMAVLALLVISFLVRGRENVFRAPSVYAIPGVMLILAILTWYSLRRPKVGLWVLAGMGLLVVSGLLPLSYTLGLLPSTFLTRNGPTIGGALEVPLVLIGLYFRSRRRFDNQVRMDAITHTDPLTGLGNHAVLMARLQKLLARKTRGAVLRVHVANLEEIRDVHGREAAEAALLRAAECVVRSANEGDLVAREQASDLVLVLDGKVSREQTAEIGRKIIARGLQFSGKLPPGVALTLRVAGVCAPLPDEDPSGLLALLARMILGIGSGRRSRPMGLDTVPDRLS